MPRPLRFVVVSIGISGLTPVPEPTSGLVPAIAALAWVARRNGRRARRGGR